MNFINISMWEREGEGQETLTIVHLLQRMQNANIRGTISFQEISAIVIAKLIHLDDALIVQFNVQEILEHIDLLWFF